MQRNALREMARCPQQWVLVLRGTYSTTVTGAACHAGVGGAMYSSTGAGATQDGSAAEMHQIESFRCCVPNWRGPHVRNDR